MSVPFLSDLLCLCFFQNLPIIIFNNFNSHCIHHYPLHKCAKYACNVYCTAILYGRSTTYMCTHRHANSRKTQAKLVPTRTQLHHRSVWAILLFSEVLCFQNLSFIYWFMLLRKLYLASFGSLQSLFTVMLCYVCKSIHLNGFTSLLSSACCHLPTFLPQDWVS